MSRPPSDGDHDRLPDRTDGGSPSSPPTARQYGDSSLHAPAPRRLTSGPTSASEGFEQMFTRFPLGCPITLIVAGLAVFEIYWVFRIATTLSLPIGGILLFAGLIALPFGVRLAIRRRKPVVLHCPHCGAVSGSGTPPFSIKRWSDTPYAYVVCSACRRDFTIDRYINAR